MSARDLSRGADDLYLAATRVKVAALSVLLRDPNDARALDAVARAAARVRSMHAELLSLAASITRPAEPPALECPACDRARREGRPWGCTEHAAEGVL